MSTKLRAFPTATISSLTQVCDTTTNKASNGAILEDMQLVTHLLSLGQMLCGHVHGAATCLSQEVNLATQGRAQLLLGRQVSAKRTQLSASEVITLPVQFRHLMYGTLSVAFDAVYAEQLAIPLPVAQLLAQTCSWILYAIEQSTFLQGQCHQLEYQVNGPLTKREREVLTLMCRGYNQETIAELLCIAPATVGKHRQHIYEQLGVHSEHDALLAAYLTGLFSIIEDSST